MKIFSRHDVTTKILGKILAPELLSIHSKQALVVALFGDLGTGKTTFVKGFIRGLGIRERIQSPTFVLYKKFFLPKQKYSQFKKVIHVDAYRLKNYRDLLRLGFQKELQDRQNLILIEWADRIKKILPKNTLSIYFFHKKKNERTILFKNAK